jgi:hypothetical protein
VHCYAQIIRSALYARRTFPWLHFPTFLKVY